MDRGAWWDIVHGGHKESEATEHVCTFVSKYSLFSSSKKNPPPPLALYPHLGIKTFSCSPLCNISQECGVCAAQLDGVVTAVTGHLGLSP